MPVSRSMITKSKPPTVMDMVTAMVTAMAMVMATGMATGMAMVTAMVTAMVITKTKAPNAGRSGGSVCFHRKPTLTLNKP